MTKTFLRETIEVLMIIFFGYCAVTLFLDVGRAIVEHNAFFVVLWLMGLGALNLAIYICKK